MQSLVAQKLITASVVGIKWERIFMYLDVKVTYSEGADREAPLDFYAVNGLYAAKIHFKAQKISQDIYRLKTNVTNNGENRCLPIGTYSVFVCRGDYKMADCEADVSIVPNIDDYSRSFFYGGKNKVYTVGFFVQEDEDELLPFRFRALTAGRNGMSFPGIPKYHPFRHMIKDFKSCFLSSRPMLKRLYAFLAKKNHDPSKKTVLFMTEQSDVIKSNLKAVSERMVARGMDKEYHILYSARAASAEPQSKKSWLEVVKKLAESDIIFVDDHAPILDWLELHDRTTVIQLWHAGAGFKSSGYSRWGHDGCPSPISCHRQYDYGIAGSKHIAPFFSEVWGINDELVLPTGMPRMDEYLDAAYREKKTKELYEKYPMCKGKKVMLFAPTYRGRNKKTAYYPYELIDFERLYQECGDEYVVLFKMHPWVNNDIKIESKYADKFLDVKTYPNINDLFYITDLLITDYSSNIFEYSLMRRPMMFFAYDKIQYSFSRGFHRDYEEAAPGKVCYTFEELMNAFAARDFEFEKVEEYVEHHFDYIDSGASDRVIDWFILGQMPENLKAEIEAQKADMEHMDTLDFTPELIGEAEEEKSLSEKESEEDTDTSEKES